MRKTFICVIALIVVAATISSCRKNVLPPVVGGVPTPHPSQPPPNPKLEETEPAVLVPVTQNVSTNIKGYYKALPARYHESNEKYPLIIYFHGGGQYGNGASDLPEVLVEGIPKLLRDKKFPPSFTVNEEKFSFIVITPQFVRSIANAELQIFLNHIKANFRVDESRIYLSGFSLGARELSDFAATLPSQIAAITAMGGLPAIDQQLQGKCSSMATGKLPIWQFHNKDDQAWPYSEAQKYIQTLNSFNPVVPPKFTAFTVGQGKLQHDSWTRSVDTAYREDGKNIYEWMLSYKR